MQEQGVDAVRPCDRPETAFARPKVFAERGGWLGGGLWQSRCGARCSRIGPEPQATTHPSGTDAWQRRLQPSVPTRPPPAKRSSPDAGIPTQSERNYILD